MEKLLNRITLINTLSRTKKILFTFLVLVILAFTFIAYKNYVTNKSIKLIEAKGGVFIFKENSVVERCPNFLKSSARLLLPKEIMKVDLSDSTLTDHMLLPQCGVIKDLATSTLATSIDSLKYLTELESLSLGNCLFTDISIISNLKSLNNLYLYKEVDSLEPIRGLTKLETLNISQFSESDIDIFKNLKNLRGLGIRVEEVPNRLLDKLQKALPKCQINVGGQLIKQSYYLIEKP